MEAWLQVKLFNRVRRSVTLTESGRRLYRTADVSLDFLDQAISTIDHRASEKITVAANSPIVMYWLTERLRMFSYTEGAPQIDLQARPDFSEIMAMAPDFAVLWGDGAFQGWNASLLFRPKLAPVTSRNLANAINVMPIDRLSDIPFDSRPPLFSFPKERPDWVDCKDWLRLMGLPTEVWNIKFKASYSDAIGAAMRGEGIAFGNLDLLSSELASGALKVLGSDHYEHEDGYYLCQPANRRTSQAQESLRQFLIQSVAQKPAQAA